MFDSTKEDLRDILRSAEEGRLQLPEFQRDYVWGDADVRSLVASVAKGFPVGALLTLETGGEIEFKPRLLAGVPAKDVRPAELLLDGQQRITSLYQATRSMRPVRTRTPKGTEVERYYFIDIKKAVAGGVDFEEAIIGVPADRVIRRNFGREIVCDLSTPQGQFEADAFPLNLVFDSRNWFFDWRDYWRARGRDVADLERDFDRGVVDRISRYEMPIIRLDKRNSREAICLVFEKVNVGGKKLDAFELVTAIYAASGANLREDWAARRARIIGSPNRRDVLSQIASTDFLQACTLLHTRELRLARAAELMRDKGKIEVKELPQVSCNRDALLGLPLHAYQKHADAVEQGFVEAGSFLNEHKIIWHKDVPYPTLIVGLAATFAILGRAAQTAAAKEKLARWFWSITLGELYGSSTESRLARDVPELAEWLSGAGLHPRSVDEALFQRDRLGSLRQRISAAYKGLHALLMRSGCRDFINGRPTDLMTFFNDKIDIHHIFPQAWCKKKGIPPNVFNSIVNKTPLSKASNIAIGGDAPSVYLRRIEQRQGLSPEALDDILRSHLIEPAHLRNDDFEAFFAARMDALAGVVAGALGKAVVDEHGADEAEEEVAAEDTAEAGDTDNTVELETA
ncbi:hypothetical protein TSH100_00730 [Azospirillum sp. TSH100]|uniref:GmrSD restriction endonuclease domain-containing protein n=1 Tax=Azospirillum sp. TSH100 TaxID=652764 RepID=UPI000D6225C0|nr:DUF262 domain-containing protein [Azospirillum sp. TSH100]PWC91441.1 hypothetical protein TSH100_00730 [Azospirillum sp. TSH100]QCG89131.1 DUF262 domain-containing protein [Azospirillum sp. TSH100]